MREVLPRTTEIQITDLRGRSIDVAQVVVAAHLQIRTKMCSPDATNKADRIHEVRFARSIGSNHRCEVLEGANRVNATVRFEIVDFNVKQAPSAGWPRTARVSHCHCHVH